MTDAGTGMARLSWSTVALLTAGVMCEVTAIPAWIVPLRLLSVKLELAIGVQIMPSLDAAAL